MFTVNDDFNPCGKKVVSDMNLFKLASYRNGANLFNFGKKLHFSIFKKID